MKLTPFDFDSGREGELSCCRRYIRIRFHSNLGQPEVHRIPGNVAGTTAVVAGWKCRIATDDSVIVLPRPADEVAFRHLKLVVRYIKLYENIPTLTSERLCKKIAKHVS